MSEASINWKSILISHMFSVTKNIFFSSQEHNFQKNQPKKKLMSTNTLQSHCSFSTDLKTSVSCLTIKKNNNEAPNLQSKNSLTSVAQREYLIPPYFHQGFHLQTFTIHRTAREGGGYLFNSALAERLLQKTHLWTQLATGLESGNFSFRAQVNNY